MTIAIKLSPWCSSTEVIPSFSWTLGVRNSTRQAGVCSRGCGADLRSRHSLAGKCMYNTSPPMAARAIPRSPQCATVVGCEWECSGRNISFMAHFLNPTASLRLHWERRYQSEVFFLLKSLQNLSVGDEVLNCSIDCTLSSQYHWFSNCPYNFCICIYFFYYPSYRQYPRVLTCIFLFVGVLVWHIWNTMLVMGQVKLHKWHCHNDLIVPPPFGDSQGF